MPSAFAGPGTFASCQAHGDQGKRRQTHGRRDQTGNWLPGQKAVVKTARGIFPLVDKVGDEPTADLLTQRMQIHEKNAWMLRSLLEN